MRVLTALDLDHPVESVLELALGAAQRLQAEAHLLTVLHHGHEHVTFQAMDHSLTPIPRGDTSGGLIPYPSRPAAEAPLGTMIETTTQVAERHLADARDQLHKLAERFGNTAVTCAVVPAAEPARAIAAYVDQQKIDLIVLGTHARTGVRRLVLGSVAEGVLRAVSVPALLAGPRLEPVESMETLIVCLDGSPFAEAILPLAEYVQRLRMRVIVVTALPGAPEKSASLPADVQEGGYVRRLAQDLRHHGVDAAWDVLHDDNAAEAINRFAADTPGSVVALTTHARHGVQRLLAGSVTMGVLHECPRPVLALPPAATGRPATAGNAPATQR